MQQMLTFRVLLLGIFVVVLLEFFCFALSLPPSLETLMPSSVVDSNKAAMAKAWQNDYDDDRQCAVWMRITTSQDW